MTIERSSHPRIEALDITKGVLVILMLVYHSLNYSDQYSLGFRYLSFLPPSFIFITGFLISKNCVGRESPATTSPYVRMALRGCKLLALFTAINLTVWFFLGRSRFGQPVSVSNFFDYWFEMYIDDHDRLARFEVLLPIAYLLLTAPLFVWINYRCRFFLLVLVASLIAFCWILD